MDDTSECAEELSQNIYEKEPSKAYCAAYFYIENGALYRYASREMVQKVERLLAEAQVALEDTKTKSATTLLAAEDEILKLKTDLKASQDKEECALRDLEELNDFKRQVQMLKDEIAILGAQKSVLQSRDIYAQERLDAQTLLRSYIDDLETVQRIIYVAAVESFHAAKKAFRQFKMRVRTILSRSFSGPESMEDAVMDYIIRQEDLYDVQSSVSEVIQAMNIHPRISFPPEVDFIMISSLIRELCRVAFSMQTLDPPLDISFATEGELFNEYK
ncbi:UNVERIFIED_CONTAM: hypothetical protein K2H54_056269 [Gekko kuhli]